MILTLSLLIFFFTFILIKSADHVVVALRHIAKLSHARLFVVSAILLALSTSLPELFVSTTSALEGVSSLSLGVVVGSNIANISLITGIAALTAGRVLVHGEFLKRDVWISLVAGVLPILLVFDKRLSRVDGLILLTVYAAYATSFFKIRFREIAEFHLSDVFFHRLFRKVTHFKTTLRREYGRLFVSVAVLLFSADLVVRLSKTLAEAIGIPLFLIGLILLAVGTSLPELVFSLRLLTDGEPTMFFGNLLGSTIANSTLIVGLAAVINPFAVAASDEYVISAASFIVIYLTFWFFIRSKFRLERWEAGVLIILYFIFVALEVV